MPYIKVSKTSSGARSVQVATKIYGKTKIIRYLGSAHTEADLIDLKAAAYRFIHHSPGQTDLFTEPFDRTRLLTIGHHPYCFESLIHFYYDKLGFEVLGPQLLFDLVMMRLYEPCSKLRSVRLLTDRFDRSYTEEGAYRLVKKLGEEKLEVSGQKSQNPYKTMLLNLLYEAHSQYYGGDLAITLYDVTTLFFESARDGDEYKVPGYSKDGKHKDPQILVGLLTNLQGFPLGYESFPGNTFEGHTLLTSLNRWRKQFPESRLRVIADAGMLSKINCDKLVEAGYDFVVGARIHSFPDNLTSQLKAMTKRNGRIQEFEYNNWRLIVQYRTKRAKKDLHTIDKALLKAQAIVDGKQTIKRRSKFVLNDEPSKTTKQLDETAIAEAKSLIGLKGYLTNIVKDKVDAKELIAQYHELWHVERSFRMSKNDLRARPIFHHKEDNIKGHLFIVIMALALSKLLEKDSGVSVQRSVDQLSNVLSYQQKDTVTGKTWLQHPDLDAMGLEQSLKVLLRQILE